MKLNHLVALACASATLFASSAWAQVHVNGYTKSDGTYVQPHERTAPNATRDDNYSTRGNVNPYTGEPGTKPRDADVYGGTTYQAPKPAPTYTAPTYTPYGAKPAKPASPYGY
jgi:hypothetical protein